MRIGLGIGGSMGEIAASAVRAERAGLDSVWVAELDRSAFVSAAAAIAATGSVTVGTAVALAFPRSPTITAMTAWDLDELSRGRFELGLGPQVKRVMEARFSVPFERPAERLEEYVRAVRTVWAANRGEPVTHHGEAYTITMPTFHAPPRPDRRDVPVLLAAVGPLMARAAGRVADGVVGHPLASPRYLAERLRPWIAEGLADAGRDETACPITATVIVSVGDDEAAARRAAKLQLAFYATTPSYRPILELHGRAELQRALRRAFVRGDHGEMAALVDDELLDGIAVAGRLDEAVHRLAAWQGIADRIVLAVPWFGADHGRAREAEDACLDVAQRAAGDARANVRSRDPWMARP